VTVSSTAPGKAVLFGEYAVLFGAPAVVLALDRRARVRIEASDDGRWSFVAPGLVDTPVVAELQADGRPRWPDDDAAGRLALVDRVLASVTASGMLDLAALPPAAVSLDTREFFHHAPSGPVKLGLGSSAALTTALVTALAVAAGRDDLLEPPLDWLRRVLAAHRHLQGGRGSGVDIAASVLGGAVEYRIDDARQPVAAARVGLPDGLHIVPVWAGRSADTPTFLQRLHERLEGPERASVERALDDLGSLTGQALEALRAGDVARVLTLVDAFCDAMRALGSAAGMEILSPEHERLRNLVQGCGAHYKPSGAGGGDIGLALTDDPAVVDAVGRVLSGAGFAVVEAAVDARGVDHRR
jgi:phosphomevalonate kinase